MEEHREGARRDSGVDLKGRVRESALKNSIRIIDQDSKCLFLHSPSGLKTSQNVYRVAFAKTEG